MSAIEGPHELKTIAEHAHDFVKTYMDKMNTPTPPLVFFTKRGIVIPDPKDLENTPRVFRRFLELAGECYARTFIARLRNENEDIVHEDALVTIASDGGDLTYHISRPFIIEKKEKQVVAILWDEDNRSHGWQSRSENRAHVETLSPQQQRMLDFVNAESCMEDKPLDLLRLLGMRIVPYPVEDASQG